MDDVIVSAELTIPAHEIAFRFSRAGGPGGQHVNTTDSRVELLWGVAGSTALSEDLRARVIDALGGRVDGTGVLRIVVDTTRSQHENRARAVARLVALVAAALRPAKIRRPTRPGPGARAERLAEKRRRSEIKRDRRAPRGGEDTAFIE